MASLMIQLLEQRLELLYDLSRREREVTRRSGDLLQQRQQNVALSLPVPARAHGQHAHALPPTGSTTRSLPGREDALENVHGFPSNSSATCRAGGREYAG